MTRAFTITIPNLEGPEDLASIAMELQTLISASFPDATVEIARTSPNDPDTTSAPPTINFPSL